MTPVSKGMQGQAAEAIDLALLTRSFGLFAAIVVLMMLTIFAGTGIGQDPLQYVRTPKEYSDILLGNPQILRLVIGLDNLFIVLYASMFLTLGTALWQRSRSRVLLACSLALLGLSGFLDLLENMHFLTMISSALQGLAIGETAIALQMWESLVKFHASYLGLFLLGFAFPGQTRADKAMRFVLRWVQLPVGLLIYVAPASVAFPLVFGRFAFFLFALILLAATFGKSKFDSNVLA